MKPKLSPRQNIIAIVYDFDKTLSPNNMQEDTIFPAYKIDKNIFWGKAVELTRTRGYERTIAYLRLLLQGQEFLQKPLRKADLNALGRKIQYFKGVTSYFQRIDRYVKQVPKEARRWNIQLEHYVISSGMKEILEGTSIARNFKEIYACEFDYEKGKAVFPKLIINDTNKTQFLFRINKGKLKLTEDINSHMPKEERRIPFENMIYIGDSDTDVPSMTVMSRYGGHTIAVFDPSEKKPSKAVLQMVEEKRAGHFAPADYSNGSLLDRILKDTLNKIVHTITYRQSSQMSLDWTQKNKQKNN